MINSEAQAVLEDWFGGSLPWTVLHHWHSLGGAYRVVVHCDHTLYFVRVFLVGDTWHISQDKTVPVPDFNP